MNDRPEVKSDDAASRDGLAAMAILGMTVVFIVIVLVAIL